MVRTLSPGVSSAFHVSTSSPRTLTIHVLLLVSGKSCLVCGKQTEHVFVLVIGSSLGAIQGREQRRHLPDGHTKINGYLTYSLCCWDIIYTYL